MRATMKRNQLKQVNVFTVPKETKLQIQILSAVEKFITLVLFFCEQDE